MEGDGDSKIGTGAGSDDTVISQCERKITHQCNHQADVILIIVANDYYNNFNLTNIDSTLNDISLVWKFFRRFKCFNPDQIFILGRLDFKGKMLPWRNRYLMSSLDLPKDKKIFFYYTGHGYSNGHLDIDPITEKYLTVGRDKTILYILDACWSHLWMGKYDSYICATNEKMEVASTSRYFSTFTLNFFKFLARGTVLPAPEVGEEVSGQRGLSIEDLQAWAEQFNYLFKCTNREEILKFLN